MIGPKIWTEGDEILATDLNKTGIGLRALEKSTPDMQLAVEPGVVSISGTIVKYAGGNSGSFSAPSSNPRIDLLCIDSAGALSIVQGTEAASPSAPTYPAGKYVIAEVYLRVGATSIKNTDDSTNGYIYRDVRAFFTGAGDQMVETFIAAETIAADDAVAIGDYQTDGGVLMDTHKTTSGQANGSGALNFSGPISVGNNANRILLVFYYQQGGSGQGSWSWNGSSMTSIIDTTMPSSGGRVGCLYLLAPSTGSQTLAITGLSANVGVRIWIYSYYNAKQSGQPDNSNSKGGTTSTSAAITPNTSVSARRASQR
ncbi:MAG TPA: hypothetical protein PKG74_03395 [Candidatus Colwellbacteria bacterium]|nr:hypothetical protein [Candidatus Colwellbacteria bacterium]